MSISTSAELENVKAKYVTLQAECSAESENLGAIDAQRQHEYEMRKADAYKELASNEGC